MVTSMFVGLYNANTVDVLLAASSLEASPLPSLAGSSMTPSSTTSSLGKTRRAGLETTAAVVAVLAPFTVSISVSGVTLLQPTATLPLLPPPVLVLDATAVGYGGTRARTTTRRPRTAASACCFDCPPYICSTLSNRSGKGRKAGSAVLIAAGDGAGVAIAVGGGVVVSGGEVLVLALA